MTTTSAPYPSAPPNPAHGPSAHRTPIQPSMLITHISSYKGAWRTRSLGACFLRSGRKRSTSLTSKVSPEGTIRKQPLDPNIALARRWIARVEERMQVVPDPHIQPKAWCAESSADVELMHRLLVFIEQHFRRRGAGKKIAEASLKYMDRTCIPLTPQTSRKLVILSTMLAIKVDDDHPFCNTTLAVCTQLSLKQLNALEYEFCESVDWELVLNRVYSVSV